MKRKPTDSTLRNVRASNTRDEKLRLRVARLEKFIRTYFKFTWRDFNQKG